MRNTFERFLDFVGGLLGAILALLYFFPPYDDEPMIDAFEEDDLWL